MPDIPQIPAFNITSKLQNQLDFNLYSGTGDPLAGTGVSMPVSLAIQEVTQNSDGTWNEKIFDQESPVKDQNEIFSQIQQDRTDLIGSYEGMASVYDSEILNFNSQINQKKTEISTLVSTAVAAGCSYLAGLAENINGVACGIGSTIREDQASLKIYSNLTNYSATNPFSPISVETLSTSNIGKGFENLTSNNSGTTVTTNYRTIPDTVAGHNTMILLTPAQKTTCAGYGSSILTLATEIATLRGQRDQYLTELNTLKNLKSKEEVKRWGSGKAEISLESYNNSLRSAIQTISQFTDAIVTDGLIVHFDSALSSGIAVTTTASTTTLTSSGIGYTVLSWNNLAGDGLYATPSGSSLPLLDSGDGPSVVLNSSSNQYFSIDNSFIGSGKIETGSSSYSIETWTKITSDSNLGISSTANGATIVGINSIYGYGMQIFKPSGIRVSLGERGNGRLTNNTNLSTGTWYHIVGVNQAGVGSKIYVNGVLDGTGTEINITSSLNSLRFSYAPEKVSQYFSGKLSVVRIYKKALSESEISQNYNAHKERYGYT